LAWALAASWALARDVAVPADVPTIDLAVTLAEAGGSVFVASGYETERTAVVITHDVSIFAEPTVVLPALRVLGCALTLEGGVLGTAEPLAGRDARPVALVQLGGALTLTDVRFDLPDDSRGLSVVDAVVLGVRLSAEGGYSRPLLGFAGSEVTLEQLSVHDFVGNVILAVSSTVRLSGADLSGNRSRLAGADLLAGIGSDVSVTNSVFSGSSTDNFGGSIAIVDSDLAVMDSAFSGGRALVGGAIAAWTTAEGAPTVSLERVAFSSVRADSAGGAVYLADAVATVTDTSFRDATVRASDPGAGGGALRADGGSLTVVRGSFEATQAPYGGAIQVLEGALSVSDTSFVDVDAWTGGGVYTYGSTVTLSAVDVSNARANLAGGALYQYGGTLSWDGGSVVDASAGYGGGLYLSEVAATLSGLRAERGFATESGGFVVAERGTLDAQGMWVADHLAASGAGFFVIGATSTRVAHSTFCDNAATDSGAALAVADAAGPVTLDHLVIGGSASGAGAAAHLVQTAPGGPATSVLNVTFANNVAAVADLLLDGGEVDVRNTIGHHGSIGVYASASTTLTGGYNLFWGNQVSVVDEADSGVLPGVEAVFADPRFEALVPGSCATSNYGLGSGSPARSAGDPAFTNEDGTRAHIGAFGGAGTSPDDSDGDGASDALDCADDDPTVHPSAVEVWYDGVDQDCDGIDRDQDGDGVAWPTDCDDRDATVAPGAEDLPGDGLDQDCRSTIWLAGGCASAGGAARGGAAALAAAVLLGRRALAGRRSG
jgi:hypothetical protein